MERLILREATRKQLIISRALKKGEYNARHLSIEDTSKNKDDGAKRLGDGKLKMWEDASPWLAEESDKRKNVDRSGKKAIFYRKISYNTCRRNNRS